MFLVRVFTVPHCTLLDIKDYQDLLDYSDLPDLSDLLECRLSFHAVHNGPVILGSKLS